MIYFCCITICFEKSNAPCLLGLKISIFDCVAFLWFLPAEVLILTYPRFGNKRNIILTRKIVLFQKINWLLNCLVKVKYWRWQIPSNLCCRKKYWIIGIACDCKTNSPMCKSTAQICAVSKCIVQFWQLAGKLSVFWETVPRFWPVPRSLLGLFKDFIFIQTFPKIWV